MSWSEAVKDFAWHSYVKKNEVLSSENQQKLRAITARMPRGGAKNQAFAEQWVEYIGQTVAARVESCVEACQLFGELMDDDDIESVVDSLSRSTKHNLQSLLELYPRILPASSRLSERYEKVVIRARRDLRMEMKRLELRQGEDPNVVIHAVTGGVQIGGRNNVQNVSVTINQWLQSQVDGLSECIQKDPTLDQYQKEDALDALHKLPELSQRERTDDLIKRVKDKLDLVKSIISISKDLALISSPYLLAIANHFHLLS